MSLRHLVFHNFWLKMFSIAAGTIIWMAIHFSMDHEITLSEPAASRHLIRETIEVPISILQEEGDTRVFQITPTTALVTVMGEAKTLHGPAGREIKMYVDLTDYHSRHRHPGGPACGRSARHQCRRIQAPHRQRPIRPPLKAPPP